MEKNIRKQIILNPEQFRKLKEEYSKTGANESWIIRRAIDEYFARKEQNNVK